MSYDVICLSFNDPAGKIVGTYPTKEAAEATREILNNTTPTSLLQFFIVKPSA
jgi:hypothetical protein